MKRLIAAACLALGVHVFVFAAAPDWLKGGSDTRPGTKALEIALVAPQKEGKTLRSPSPEKKVQTEIPSVKKEKGKEKKAKKAHKKKEEEHNKGPAPEVRPAVEKKENPKLEVPEKLQEKPPQNPEKPAESGSPPAQKEASPTEEQASDTWDDINEEILARADPGTGHVTGVRKSSSAGIPEKVEPEYRHNPAPEYPRIARKRGYQGTVVVKVLVDRNGAAEEIRVIESSGHPVLDRAALSAIRGWDFEPGMRKGAKVDMWVKIPICFELR